MLVAWKNYLTADERNGIVTECDKYHWSLQGWSQLTEETRFFWMKDLIKSIRSKNLFKYKIEDYLTKEIEIIRIYANGQSHGQCGMFHQDTPGCDCTLVYYLHENWKPEYGGHLMIKNGGNIESYWPESNSAILFRSDLWHCPLEPTVFCKTQRESIAVKFRIL